MNNRDILKNLLEPLTKNFSDGEKNFYESRLDKYFSLPVEAGVMQKIADLIDAYERAEIKTTKEFAEKVYSLGYNDHLNLMNKALQSENIFGAK